MKQVNSCCILEPIHKGSITRPFISLILLTYINENKQLVTIVKNLKKHKTLCSEDFLGVENFHLNELNHI